MILHIETSTDVCSVALSNRQEILFKKADYNGMNHAALLNGFIQEALETTQTDKKALKAVSVSSGPGSYTGLRIGVSTAKGLCYGLDIPLIAISTLEILALPVMKQIGNEEENLFCPMIDARRMEVYCQLFDAQVHPLTEVMAHELTEESFREERTAPEGLLVFGNGSGKCRELFKEPNVHFVEVVPSARGLVKPAFEAFRSGKFEDTAYFEPFYLKNFVVKPSSKKIF